MFKKRDQDLEQLWKGSSVVQAGRGHIVYRREGMVTFPISEYRYDKSSVAVLHQFVDIISFKF